MSHAHHHDSAADDRSLTTAVSVNLGLTVAQLIGGILSNSLSLIADALHNFSDAASLGIALFARKISRKPPDRLKTFGYKRAELIAALINLTALIIIGLYLVYEALFRLFQPVPVAGWTVVTIAGIALVIDTVTAVLTYRLSRHSLNIRAAFLHNLSDALSSVGVMLAGAGIIWFGWHWLDPLLTLLIAGYVLYQGFSLMPKTVHILMEGAPERIDTDDLIRSLEALDQVESVHHLHLWQLDEHRVALEAHVVVLDCDLQHIEAIKKRIKRLLEERYHIEHSTLEIEVPPSACEH